MEIEGVLQDWHDDKGYGFIAIEGSRTRYFAHIHAFRSKYPRPRDGDKCSFSATSDSEGRPRATQILRPGFDQTRPSYTIPFLTSAAYALWIGFLYHQGLIPNEMPIALVALSLVSFGLYGLDKRRAKRHAFRISEARLHLIDLLGGWPGGWFAQLFFRHKISKPSFYYMFYLGILIHIFFLAYTTSPSRHTSAKFYFDLIALALQRLGERIQGLF